MKNQDIQIGIELRNAREAAGYTVADVVHRAHLPRSVIEALEAEDFSVFASPTYAKSFLTQYSEFLGVDATPWLDALEPVEFVQTEGLHSIFETGPSSPRLEIPRARKESGGYAFSTILLMAITGGLVYGAYKVVEYMERISTDPAETATPGGQPDAAPALQQEAAGSPAVTSAPGLSTPPQETQEDESRKVVLKRPEEQHPGPPPRAIPVQDQ